VIKGENSILETIQGLQNNMSGKIDRYWGLQLQRMPICSLSTIHKLPENSPQRTNLCSETQLPGYFCTQGAQAQIFLT